jgi:ATP-dependent DNA helicase RecG
VPPRGDNQEPSDFRELGFETEGFFRTVFYRCPEFAPATAALETRVKTRVKARVKTRVMILGAIIQDPRITRAELAEMTGLTLKGIEWNIKRLTSEKVLRRIGSDKGGRWEVLTPPGDPAV